MFASKSEVKNYLSSSSLAQQFLLCQDLLQKLLPAVPIRCSIPPISLHQLPGIFHHTSSHLSFCLPFCLPPSTTATRTLFVGLRSSIRIACRVQFNRLILMYVTISLSFVQCIKLIIVFYYPFCIVICRPKNSSQIFLKKPLKQLHQILITPISLNYIPALVCSRYYIILFFLWIKIEFVTRQN